jgi:hypothetical protein
MEVIGRDKLLNKVAELGRIAKADCNKFGLDEAYRLKLGPCEGDIPIML